MEELLGAISGGVLILLASVPFLISVIFIIMWIVLCRNVGNIRGLLERILTTLQEKGSV